jgi:hypothetical protein
MNITELRENLEKFYINNTDGIVVYFILKDNNEMKVRLADIEHRFLRDLKDQYLSTIREMIINTNNTDVNDLQVLNISTADDRKNVIYEYDLEDKPKELSVINEILLNGEQENFSSSDNIDNLFAYVITIGNNSDKLAIYRKHFPISKFSAQRNFLLFQSNQRFIRMENDMIRLDHKFDVISIKGILFVNNLKLLEKSFGFHDIIKRKAEENIKKIEFENIIEDSNSLLQEIDNISFARKIVKNSSNSPVLGIVPANSIIEFTKNHPHLRGKLKYSIDGSKIKLDTKVSKELFLKLLSDNFLQSELTKAYYESLAKDNLDL